MGTRPRSHHWHPGLQRECRRADHLCEVRDHFSAPSFHEEEIRQHQKNTVWESARGSQDFEKWSTFYPWCLKPKDKKPHV